MTKQTKQPRIAPEDQSEAGSFTQDQERVTNRLVSRIGKVERPTYQGARSYQMLPEDRA